MKVPRSIAIAGTVIVVLSCFATVDCVGEDVSLSPGGGERDASAPTVEGDGSTDATSDGLAPVDAGDASTDAFTPPPAYAAHCSDEERNSGETDLDCGGPCAPCAVEKACAGDSDCASGKCRGSCSEGNRCQVPADCAFTNVCNAPFRCAP